MSRKYLGRLPGQLSLPFEELLKKDSNRPYDIRPTVPDATNKFEAASYLKEVRENYETLINEEPDRFHRIDATQSESEVVETARETVMDLIE